MAQHAKYSLGNLPAAPVPTKVINIADTMQKRLTDSFKPVFDAAKVVLDGDVARAKAENDGWRALADSFYDVVLVPYYNIAERTIKRELQNYIATVTGADFVVSTKDKTGLSSVARFFLTVDDGEPSRQDVSRLATLGWAGCKLNVKPSVAMADKANFAKERGVDTINGFLANVRDKYGSEIDPDRAANKEKAKANRLDSAANTLITEPSVKLAELIQRLPDVIGTTFNPEEDKIILGFTGSNVAKAMMADLLGIPEDDKTEHLIRIRRRNGTFDVVWCDVTQVPPPEEQRALDREGEGPEGEPTGEEPDAGE